jgi:hypothetical protein
MRRSNTPPEQQKSCTDVKKLAATHITPTPIQRGPGKASQFFSRTMLVTTGRILTSSREVSCYGWCQMNSTALSLALRIAQLLEEHSETELQEALSLLERHGLRSELLDYLAQRKADSRASRPKRKSESTRPRLEDTTSRAVLRLRDSDPDKFRLLSEFDLMVRRGQVLATLEDLKRFGERISKDFQPRK